ncbi:hypothetical protein B0H14DRAFT_3087046 [Mycena olivaceomarginata]|nr:hypothetical protein B0H14DRAFT_3087046 [Mycena olivaceomarginata]
MAYWASTSPSYPPTKQAWTPSTRRRQVLCISLGVLALFLLLGVAHPTTRKMGQDYYAGGDELNGVAPNPPLPLKLPGPPSYEALRKWEDELPQHNLDLPFPEGRTGRYVKFSTQMNLVGWNNCLNERLMNAHLAYMSKRAYVFNDYVWAPEHYMWPLHQQPPNGPRTPLNAILSGPMAGGPWDPSDPAPRSISERWFDVVCPQEERRVIVSADIKPPLADLPGAEVFAAWETLLRDAPERCVEIVSAPYEVDKMPQVFDLWIWGSARVLSLWPSFSQSPTSRLLAASPIVRAAVERNAYLFNPRGPRLPAAPRDWAQRTLAIHVRRGDFIQHCRNLAGWGSSFYSWAQLPQVLDQFTPLPGDDPKRVETMMGHCLPDNAQIIKKLHDVREDYINNSTDSGKDGRVLDVLYLLTNEQGPWLDELKVSMKGAGWSTIVTSRDLLLDVEQEEVGMAVDMELARRAAVFIGNGWSSFTSNIIHQRLVDGREPLSIRLT